MGNLHIKIKYLYHSGFIVETDKNLLLFDYYQGEEVESLVKMTKKNVFIFCSHSHPDHFNPVILEWQKDRSDIHYILGDDINLVQQIQNKYYFSPYEKLNIGSLEVKAYNSTDLGVSFLVKDNGINLFHAGDLNWWYWSGDTPQGKAQAEREFKNEIMNLKQEKIDIAFFPVDPRLEQNYRAGGEYFIQELAPRFFIPMHFADHPEITTDFENYMKEKQCPSEIIKFLHKGQEVQI